MLLDTFLQSISNKRTDRFGGSFENRFRVVEMVMRAVLSVFEPGQVGMKISPNCAYNGIGSKDIRESFLYYLRRLTGYKLGYLQVTIGLDFGYHGYGEPMTMSEVREMYTGTLMGNMGFTPESAEKGIHKGDMDMVAFGRPFLNNPDLVERIRVGRKLNAMLDHQWWYSSVDRPLTREGYTDLSVAELNIDF